MKKSFFIFFILVSLNSEAKLKVVATTTDLMALVQTIGQDQVEVISLSRGNQNVHQIEAKPSLMLNLRDKDLVLAHGLELETSWLPALIQGSRNSKLMNSNLVLELGAQLEPLDVPSGTVSRAQGDVHAGGNPHFQLDPIRLGKAGQLIADKLSQLDPIQKSVFKKNADAFQKNMEVKTILWTKRLQKFQGKSIVTYHKHFAYFCHRFQIQCDLQLEPKPGIPPTANHLLGLVQEIKKRKISVILTENYFSLSASEKIKKEVDRDRVDVKKNHASSSQDDTLKPLVIERVPVSVGGESTIKTNEDLIENLVTVLEKSLK